MRKKYPHTCLLRIAPTSAIRSNVNQGCALRSIADSALGINEGRVGGVRGMFTRKFLTAISRN